MISVDWIDAKTACALLSVKPQTLYAYVSRGRIRATADQGDSRRSLYARADVVALSAQNRRPRARAEVAEQAIRWGDPILTTHLSEVRDEMVWLRGCSLADCAEHMSLEDVLGHLLQAELPPPNATPPAEKGLAGALHFLSLEKNAPRVWP